MRTLLHIARAILALPKDLLISINETILCAVSGGRPLLATICITNGLVNDHLPQYVLGTLLMLFHIAVKVEDYKILNEIRNQLQEEDDTHA